MSGEELTTSKTFQERMFEEIRGKLGSLLTDEELKKIVASTVDKAFFEPYMKKTGSWGDRDERVESPFVTMMRDTMKVRVEKAVDEWIAANPQKYEQAVKDALAAGVYGLVQAHILNITREPVLQFQNALINAGVIKP